MPRFPHLVTGKALVATGATLTIPAVASVILLSSTGLAAAGTAGSHVRPVALQSVSTPAVGGSTTLSLRATKLGKILVASNGHTVHAFSRDRRNQDRCSMISGCTGVWPIVAAHGKLRAGSGVKASLLGTIRLGRVSQVTYAGHPLYTYTADSGPGETAYVGVSQFGGSWPALSSTGRVVK